MPTTKKPPMPKLTFFGDSSSRDEDYMVVGGFAVADFRIERIEREIADSRASAGIQSEFHWKKYRGGARKKAYFDLVDYAFGLVEREVIALHVLIARFGDSDHNRGDGRKKHMPKNARKDQTINRLYAELLIHKVAKFYGSKRAIKVRLDQGGDSAYLLRRGAAEVSWRAYNSFKESFGTKPHCIKSIEAHKSEEYGLIQMADVIVGGIAASRNERKLNPVKSELRDYILKRSGVGSWRISTPKENGYLTVWNHGRNFDW